MDLRSIGSNTSIYSDASRSLSDRAATLIVDVLNALYDELYTVALTALDRAPHAEQLTTRIDDLGAAISTIRITGTVDQERSPSQLTMEELSYPVRYHWRTHPRFRLALPSRLNPRGRSRAGLSGQVPKRSTWTSVRSRVQLVV